MDRRLRQFILRFRFFILGFIALGAIAILIDRFDSQDDLASIQIDQTMPDAYIKKSKNRAPASDNEIPTGLPPSPLFGARPFTQKMMLLEEFGTLPVPATGNCADCEFLPEPDDCESSPDSQALDDFLLQPLYPAPRIQANTDLPNPWSGRLSECYGRNIRGNIEGRPPGPNFAHQRFQEFFPRVYTQTVTAGARTNTGLRDRYQRHGYSTGEFAPGGLYHNTTGQPGFDGTTRGIQVQPHPNFPVQHPNSVWTYDGTFPPKLLQVRYQQPILFRHYNALPIDVSYNNGFGINRRSTHLHNGHQPGESDGFANAYFYSGAFYDYRWPLILSGHDSINTNATDPRASTPNGNGGLIRIRGDYRETMSSQWFHDHTQDFTAPNVYKGDAAMANIYSGIDRGREPRSLAEAQGSSTTPGYGCHYANPNNVNLCIASGSGLDWGNRDYDVNLMLADKAFDQNGQLIFNPFNTDGFLGDVMTVNGLYKPYFEVRARRYRFRLLNASVARTFAIAVVDQNGRRIPYHMIANDGNIMEHAVPFPNTQSQDLPELAVAERYDIIIDFKSFKEGDKIYFINLAEHDDGRGPKELIPLNEILRGKYDFDDPVVGKFLEFRVKAHNQPDLSMNPADYVEGKKKMIPLHRPTAAELSKARVRLVEFGRSDGTDEEPWTIKVDNGRGFVFDPKLIAAAPDRETLEIWKIRNGSGGGWSHPVHIHFEEGQILKRGGKAPPIWEKYARKDIYRIGRLPNSTDSVDVAIRFRDFYGIYMEHCHNTLHEDNAMLLRVDIENPGQLVRFQTPVPTIDGVTYVGSKALPTADTGLKQ